MTPKCPGSPMDAESTCPDARDRRREITVLAVTIPLVLSLGVLASVTVPRDGTAGGASVLGETVTASAAAAPRTVALDDGVALDIHLPTSHGDPPVLLYVHGGGWTSGHRDDVPDELGVLDLVDQGWVVISVGYRRADPAAGVTAMDQADDVAVALEWIRDERRALGLGDHVVAMGHSAGAHLVALSAATMPVDSRPDAVLLVSGVYDFGTDVVANPLLGPAVEAALGCTSHACVRRSPLEPATFADAGDPPVTIVHGLRDRVVSPTTAARYGRALERAGVEVDLQMVSGGRHLGDPLGRAARSVLDTWTDRSRHR